MSWKLGDKVTSVSVNINFGARMSILWKKKKWNFGRNVDFFIKWLSFCTIHLFKKKVSNSDKKKTSVS